MGTLNPGGSIPRSVDQLGANTKTIGVDGYFSNLADAVAWRNTLSHTLLTNFTGSSTVELETRAILADSGTPLSSYTGQDVLIRVAGGGPYFRANIAENNRLVVRYPLSSAIISQTVEVFRENTAAFFILPGTRLVLGTAVTIPSFTKIFSIPGSSQIFADFSNSNGFTFPNTA